MSDLKALSIGRCEVEVQGYPVVIVLTRWSNEKVSIGMEIKGGRDIEDPLAVFTEALIEAMDLRVEAKAAKILKGGW